MVDLLRNSFGLLAGRGLGIGRQGGSGSTLRQLLALPTFDATGKLVPGLWEETRSTEIRLPDLDGVHRVIPAEYPAYSGGRIVNNLINTIPGASNLDFSSYWSTNNITLTPGVTDPDGGSTATTLTASGGVGYVLIQPAVTNGAICDFRNSIWIRRRTGAGNLYMYHPNDTSKILTSIVTTSWQRIASNITVGKSATTLRIGVVIVSDGDAIDIWRPQAEDVTGAAIQSPGEAQIVDATHDGVAIYNTENGNTVDGNGVVTDVVGAAVSPVPILEHHPATTNVFLNSDAPATQDITLTVGTWATSIFGTGSVTTSAGTATASGYGAATEGSDNVVVVTVEGTVTFTVAGTVDLTQVENKDFSTPPVITAGASASRTTCGLRTAFSSAIFKQASGFSYIDLTPLQAQSLLTATDEGVMSVADSATNLIFVDSNGLNSTDDTSTATVDPSYAADTKIRFLVYWDSVGDALGIGYRTLPGGTFTWAVEQAYDDDFTAGSYFNIMYGNLHSHQIHDLGVFNKHQTQTYYEANY